METKAYAYEAKRHCPKCRGTQPSVIGYHPMARTVYAHCLACNVTRALPRV